MDQDDVTPAKPIYSKFPHEGDSSLFGVTCNEGWRSSVVCSGMYEWAADWLVEQLQGKPFALAHRP